MSDERRIVGYDPMTGEPVYEEPQATEQRQIIGYDPMTGAPVYEEPQPQAQTITGYDPMTGQPIYASAPQVQDAPKKNRGKLAAVIGGIVAAVLVIAVLVGVIGTQLVLGKNGRLLLAASKTVSNIPLVETLQLSKWQQKKEYTVEVDADVEGASVNATLSQDLAKKQASLTGDVRYNGVGSDFTAYLDQEQLQLQAKDLVDQTLFYSFTDEPTGYLADLMAQAGINLSDVNDAMQKAWSSDDAKEAQAAGEKLLLEQFRNLEFEKIDADKFEVDGKDRKCKGYTTQIDGDVLVDWLDAYEDWYLDYLGDYVDLMAGYDMDIRENFQEIRSELYNVDPVDLDIYLYKKQIAAIEVSDSISRQSVVLEIQGGEYPLQNWTFSTKGMEDRIKISQKGETDKGTEKIKWYVNAMQIAEMKYEHESGDIRLGAKDGDKNLFYIKGSITQTRNGFECKLDDLQVEGEAVNASGTMKVSDKADISKPDSDDLFDMGNATEEMWWTLFQNSQIGSLLYF